LRALATALVVTGAFPMASGPASVATETRLVPAAKAMSSKRRRQIAEGASVIGPNVPLPAAKFTKPSPL
jgi:hypothetical protein